jgi:outer membrane receptor protein involved in Fe transport
VFGERLTFNSEDYTPDVYEQARNQVDIITSQRIFSNMRFRFSVKNLLDEEIKYTQDFKGKEYIAEAYKPGRSISVGVSYSL